MINQNNKIKPTVSIASDGTKEYRVNGKLHRVDGPAVERADGTKEWYVNDKLHRIDGPAVEFAHGTKMWYVNGKVHRVGGPAIEYAHGTKMWYVNNKRHRVDGPAVEHANGDKEWWVNDKRYTKSEFDAKMKSHNESVNAISEQTIDAIDDINEDVKPTVSITPSGTKEYRVNGKLHRTDGPAVEGTNGYKAWFVNGERHRKNGPAIEYANGDKAWYVNNKLHNTNGPAFEHANGDKHWYINGVQHTESEFDAKTKSRNRKISEQTIELLDAISSEDTIAATKLFNAAIALKLAEMIEERRQEVAQNMFEAPNEPTDKRGDKFRHVEWANGDKEYYVNDVKHTKAQFDAKLKKHKLQNGSDSQRMFESVAKNIKYGVFRNGEDIDDNNRYEYHPVHGALISTHRSKDAAIANAELSNSPSKIEHDIKYHVKLLTPAVLNAISEQ